MTDKQEFASRCSLSNALLVIIQKMDCFKEGKEMSCDDGPLRVEAEEIDS